MLPVPDLVTTRDAIEQLSERLREVYDETVHTEVTDPAVLDRALTEVLDAVHRRTHGPAPEAEARHGEPAIAELCDHGIDLLMRLADTADRLALQAEARGIRALTLPLACCVGRAGGELSRLPPIVDASVHVAEALREPSELAQLYAMLDDIVDAAGPRAAGAPADSETAHAWRMLLINRAVVATRSLQPALMASAYDALIEHLPEDAARFFYEGVAQLQGPRVPAVVRTVVERYERQFRSNRRLH